MPTRIFPLLRRRNGDILYLVSIILLPPGRLLLHEDPCPLAYGPPQTRNEDERVIGLQAVFTGGEEACVASSISRHSLGGGFGKVGSDSEG